MKRFCVLLSLFSMALALASANAQTIPSLDSIKNHEELTRVVAALDKELFDAYNTCNIAKLGTLVTDDLEFYHDKTGLAVGKQIFLDSIKNNICGKVTRQLVPGTLEAHPLHGYGVVEIGVHRFYHPGAQEAAGEGKFVTLWQYKDGTWKVSRAISYDHEPAR
jgi:hypothetical protein